MRIRSLSVGLIMLIGLALVGCQNAIEGLKRDFQIVTQANTIAVPQPLTCYRTVGNGVRLFSGADCGGGAYILSDVLQGRINSQYEENRIADEYQTALSGNLYGNMQYKISTTIPEGNVVIDIRAFASKQYGPSQCRSFFEHTTLNGRDYADNSRSACRENGARWLIVNK